MAVVHEFTAGLADGSDAGTDASRWRRLMRLRKRNYIDQERAYGETVTFDEVIALVHHVVETGLDPDGKITGQLDEMLVKFHRERDEDARDQLHTEILKAYAALTASTYQGDARVNGRTVLNSHYVRWNLLVVGFFGLLSFAAAAATHILANYYAELSAAPTEADPVYWLYRYVLVYLLPAFWGALGATVFLAMKISEQARKSTFDARKLRGQMSRIALGAVFASVLVHLFYSTLTFGGFEAVGPSGVAFLAGLGVKAIYGGFEALVNRISDWVESFDPRKQPGNTT